MSTRNALATLVLLLACDAAPAADKLVLDIDLEEDTLSVSHAIDGFIFQPTVNRNRYSDRDLNAALKGETLRNHVAFTGIVKLNGEIAGFATEQEIVTPPTKTQKLRTESAWLITLNKPDLRGVIAVRQSEDGGRVFEIVRQVLENPQVDWPDRTQRFLSTTGTARVQLASDELTPYEGGIFEEYNTINAADLKRFGRFRGSIRFVIYPRGMPREPASK